MGLLSSAKDKLKKAKDDLTSKVKKKVGKSLNQHQEIQDEMNHYRDLEAQVEDDLSQGKRDVADQEAMKIESMEEKAFSQLRMVDEELLEILSEEFQDVELVASVLQDREKVERNIKNKVRQIGEEHQDFDSRLSQAIGNFREYLEETKQDPGNSSQVYRSEVGAQAKTIGGKNWQDLAQEAQHMKDSVETVVNQEEVMRNTLQLEEQTLEQFEEEWKQTLKSVKEFEAELNTFIGEEEELESIAEKLGDQALEKNIVETESGASKLKESVKELHNKEQKIESALAKIEKEDEAVIQQQTNVEQSAEHLKAMTGNALEEVEEIRQMVLSENGEFSNLQFNSMDNWKAEIEVIEKSLESVGELLEKFEEIEETEINIENKEENVLDTEISQGRKAADDD